MPDATTPPDDWQSTVLRAFAIALERRFPGLTEEAHEILVEQVALDDVIRLYGKRAEPSIRRAHLQAERWVAPMAVVVTKHAKFLRKDAKRAAKGAKR